MEKCPTYHIPVMLSECVDALVLNPQGQYADMTFGGGGHSREILKRLTGHGHLYSFDQDRDAEGNARPSAHFTFVRSNFRYLKNWMRYHGVIGVDNGQQTTDGREEDNGQRTTDGRADNGQRTTDGTGLDGILADLGVSSHHFDAEERGFSFRFDAPLDMRMNGRGGQTAADVLNTYSEEQLTKIFQIYGEIRQGKLLARNIIKERTAAPILTTGQLRELVAVIEPKRYGARGGQSGASGSGILAQAFQALRIEVNHEMEALEEMLTAATQCLKPGGRLVVMTYHSLEDRMVKNFIKAGNVEGRVEQDFFGNRLTPLAAINNKVIVPTAEEQAANPRSRSAKLRIAEKK